MRTGTIYIIKNNINKKVYIGQTTMSAKERFMCHLKPSTQKQRSTYKLYNAIAKYGKENFYFEILEEEIPLKYINEKEIYYISTYDSYKNGYNSTPGGDGRVFNKISDEKEIIQKVKEGMKVEEIAKIYNVHKETIFRTLRRLNINIYNKLTEKELIESLEKGMKYIEIAEKYNVSDETVRRRMIKYGIKSRYKPRQ